MNRRRSVPWLWLRRGWLHLLLPLALLLAQSAGLRHGVLHPHAAHVPGSAGLHLSAGAAVSGATASAVDHHEEGSALCRLVDHLGHADLLPTATVTVAQAARPPLAPAIAPAGAAPCTTTAYEARGPPATAQS